MRRSYLAGDVSIVRAGSRMSAFSPRVPVAIRNDAASRIATVRAAVTMTTGDFIQRDFIREALCERLCASDFVVVRSQTRSSRAAAQKCRLVLEGSRTTPET